MIKTSVLFNEIIKRSSRTFRARFLKDGEVLDCDIKKVIVQKGACAENFMPGTVYIPHIRAEVSNLSSLIENEELLLQIGLLLDDGTVEYTNQGYFTVSKPERTEFGVSFDAIGRISSRLNVLPDLPNETTLENLANAITQKTGVAIIVNGVTLDGTVTESMNGLTCKEILEVIVSVLGAFGSEDGEGNIVISKYSTTSTVDYNGDYTTTSPKFSDYNYTLSGIKVVSAMEYADDDGNTVPERAYAEGVPSLILNNAYMTEGLFANFVQNTVGYTFKPGEILLALGDPRIEPWDSISFTDLKGEVHIVPCLELTHTYDGGLSTEVIAKGKTDTESSFEAKGPIQKQIERLTADLFTAKDAIVKRIKADQVAALVAELGYVTADEINSKLAEFGYMTADSADIKYAKIDKTNIDEAWIQDLLVRGNLLADSFTAATGSVTKYLTSVKIHGDLVETETLKANALILQGEDGIYRRLNINALGQAVVDSDPKYNNGLDGSVLVKESITADKINVTDLTAFGATIGGFNIGEDSIYSGVKESVENTTRGIYMDNTGQFQVGDATNYMKYYRQADGSYRLEVSADSIIFRVNGANKNMNQIVEGLDDANRILANWCHENDATLINGAKIYTGTVTADKIDVDDLFAKDITATGSITGATLYGSHVEVDSGRISFFEIDELGILADLTGDGIADFAIHKDYFIMSVFEGSDTSKPEVAHLYMDDLDGGRAIIYGKNDVSVRTNRDFYIVHPDTMNAGKYVQVNFDGTEDHFFTVHGTISAAGSSVYTGSKTSTNDGLEGARLGENGRLYLSGTNPTVFFYASGATEYSSYIQHIDADDMLTFGGASKYRFYNTIVSGGSVYSGGKMSSDDGVAGAILSSNGRLFLQSTSDGNPYIAFYKNGSVEDDAYISYYTGDDHLRFGGALLYRFDNILQATSLRTTGNLYTNYEGDYSEGAYIYAPWKDGSNHAIAFLNTDGLTAYFGWSGSSTYSTVSVLRGRTVKYTNSAGTTTLSDERLKKDFISLDEWDDVFDAFKPWAYRMKNGDSDRYHFGFSAQQIEQALLDNGKTTKDFAGLVKMMYQPAEDDPESNTLYAAAGIMPGTYEYGLVYTEFIAMNTCQIQNLKVRFKTHVETNAAEHTAMMELVHQLLDMVVDQQDQINRLTSLSAQQ